MIRWLLSLFRHRPVTVRGWRTCDSAKRISTPGYFGTWGAVLRFRDRLLAEVLAGRKTRGWYYRRLKRVAKLYDYERRYDREAAE